MLIEPMRRAWMEVDCRALRANYAAVTQRIPAGCRVLPMVKANGYGIGASLAIKSLRTQEPWGFGVATAEEGVEVRAAGWEGPVVVFTPTIPSDLADLRAYGLEPVVTGNEALRACADRGRERGAAIPVHLEVDTGMGRFGFPWSEAGRWSEHVSTAIQAGGLTVRSTFTHFHSAETDSEATFGQWSRLQSTVSELRRRGIGPGLVHAANSAAILEYSAVAGDMVRPGVWLYGAEVGKRRPEVVARVRARVLDVRDVDAGTTVSYGATYRTPGPARLATLAIGYADGLSRALSGRGRALIHGQSAPIRGVVTMDSTVVDVTGNAEVKPGDVATLVGRDGDEEISLEELAEACGTISYEILTGWSYRVPRIGFDGDACV
ncbi:MAG: alanine racemase [Gemmatimonadota bacterium]|nr:alanine racemase [Gemmatimonadota bacterium]